MHVHVCIPSLQDVFLQLCMRIVYLSRLKRTVTVSHDHGSHMALELKFLVTVTALAKVTKKLAEYLKEADVNGPKALAFVHTGLLEIAIALGAIAKNE